VHGKEKRGHGEGEGYTIGSTERFVVSASASWQTDDDGGGLEKEKATGELGFLKLKGKMEGKRNLRMRQGSVKLQGMLATVTELMGDAIRRGSSVGALLGGLRRFERVLTPSINAGREGAP
jgi:hypothetical protein